MQSSLVNTEERTLKSHIASRALACKNQTSTFRRTQTQPTAGFTETDKVGLRKAVYLIVGNDEVEIEGGS